MMLLVDLISDIPEIHTVSLPEEHDESISFCIPCETAEMAFVWNHDSKVVWSQRCHDAAYGMDQSKLPTVNSWRGKSWVPC